jgi:hypothetical protein
LYRVCRPSRPQYPHKLPRWRAIGAAEKGQWTKPLAR